MRELDRERAEQTYQSSRLETETSGNRPGRSRKRRKKSRGFVKFLGILLLCLCLGGAAWTAVRFAQSASQNNQEAVLETSRQVVPQTIPEGGAETFQ